MEEKNKQIIDIADRLLVKRKGRPQRVSGVALITGDGSQRVFYRLRLDNGRTIVGVMPNEESPFGLREAASSWFISRHLSKVGVPVPEPLAYDSESGFVLFEDLGDMRLYDLLGQYEFLREDCRFAIYREVIRELIRMQVEGREGFDTAWCWQTPHYDRELMLERESRYFLQALCHDFFGLRPDGDSLNREFFLIADRASLAPSGFFLHRDFQSRNIMVEEGVIRIIDFQGGRLGPLGYDLASLLIDPYVRLSPELQETLFDEYISELVKRVRYDPLAFREEYLYLAMQRNLQILGAFAFLGRQQGKTFFLDFIRPALESMHALLRKADSRHYPVLTGVIDTCLERIGERGDVEAEG